MIVAKCRMTDLVNLEQRGKNVHQMNSVLKSNPFFFPYQHKVDCSYLQYEAGQLLVPGEAIFLSKVLGYC